jgi:hypothetical protein
MGAKTHGIDGNETADQSARSGPSCPFVGPQLTLGISAKVAKRVIRDWTRRKHEHQSICGQRQVMGFYKAPSAQTAGKLLNLSRNQLQIMTESLTALSFKMTSTHI